MSKPSFGTGVIYIVFAYFIWGISPLFWKLLVAIHPLHILAFRILFSLILVSSILFIMKNFSWINIFKDKKEGLLLFFAGIVITINWGIYIWAINFGHAIEAALGYYINPLLSIILGLIFFREKINFLQIIAFILAVIGVVILTIITGSLPWYSVSLALTFGIYGLIKKTVKLSALESLGSETLAAIPISIVLMACSFSFGDEFPKTEGLSYLANLPVVTLILIPVCGIITTLPLFLFAKGVKILPLSTTGFIQFIAPTLTFLTGVFIFRESFPAYNFIVFGLIWTAVILYIVSLKVMRNGKVTAEQ